MVLFALNSRASELLAQSIVTSDTDSIVYEKPPARFISNAIFQFDNRNERYYGTRARMNGLKLGLEFYKRLRMGFGFYGNTSFYMLNYELPTPNYQIAARLNYNTTFAELVVFRSFRWELSTSLARGNGRIRIDTFDMQPAIPVLVRRDTITDIRLWDYGVNAQFKIFPWFGLGFGVGYRSLVLPEIPSLQTPFSNPYVDFKIKIFLGYAIRGIFSPQKIEEERLYYQQRSRERWKKFRSIVNQ